MMKTKIQTMGYFDLIWGGFIVVLWFEGFFDFCFCFLFLYVVCVEVVFVFFLFLMEFFVCLIFWLWLGGVWMWFSLGVVLWCFGFHWLFGFVFLWFFCVFLLLSGCICIGFIGFSDLIFVFIFW